MGLRSLEIFCERIVFIRQNLTSTDIRFCCKIIFEYALFSKYDNILFCKLTHLSNFLSIKLVRCNSNSNSKTLLWLGAYFNFNFAG